MKLCKVDWEESFRTTSGEIIVLVWTQIFLHYEYGITCQRFLLLDSDYSGMSCTLDSSKVVMEERSEYDVTWTPSSPNFFFGKK